MPTITWTAGPEGTTGYALVYQDLTNGLAHWAMWGIPADTLTVGPDNIPAGAQQSNFQQGMTWIGTGSCCNTYELVVYALSGPVTGSQLNAVRDALEGNTGGIVLGRDYGRVAALEECTPTMACPP